MSLGRVIPAQAPTWVFLWLTRSLSWKRGLQARPHPICNLNDVGPEGPSAHSLGPRHIVTVGAGQVRPPGAGWGWQEEQLKESPALRWAGVGPRPPGTSGVLSRRVERPLRG